MDRKLSYVPTSSTLFIIIMIWTLSIFILRFNKLRNGILDITLSLNWREDSSWILKLMCSNSNFFLNTNYCRVIFIKKSYKFFKTSNLFHGPRVSIFLTIENESKHVNIDIAVSVSIYLFISINIFTMKFLLCYYSWFSLIL